MMQIEAFRIVCARASADGICGQVVVRRFWSASPGQGGRRALDGGEGADSQPVGQRTGRVGVAGDHQPPTCLEYIQAWYGPVLAAFTAVGDDGREQLEADLLSVFESRNTADDGTLAMDVAYLKVVGVTA